LDGSRAYLVQNIMIMWQCIHMIQGLSQKPIRNWMHLTTRRWSRSQMQNQYTKMANSRFRKKKKEQNLKRC
jgi:peptidoglycan transpeptidase precursor, ErfK-YbiS-YhnG family